MYGSVTLYGHSFQNVPLAIEILRRGPTTPAVHCYITGLGSSPVARHYWGNHCCFLFLRVLRCFSSPGLPLCLAEIAVLQTAGLSHSEISGSKVICTSPELIAAYHVLHRLREPRHPPCALTCFSYFFLRTKFIRFIKPIRFIRLIAYITPRKDAHTLYLWRPGYVLKTSRTFC